MGQKPLAEVDVEGELSPFEDETLYRILRKSFLVEHPTYLPREDENLATQVNVTFHYPYNSMIFTELLREDWRRLKDLFKQITHRRGRAGAAFTLKFSISEIRVQFNSRRLNEQELASALDQIGHLTSIVGQMTGPKSAEKSIVKIEAEFDQKSDRWYNFLGSSLTGDKYVFDESEFLWVPAIK